MNPARKQVRCLDTQQLRSLHSQACALGQRCVTLDCAALHDMEAVLQGLGQALALPAYYGANFDALYDCLTDLEPGPPRWAAGLVLLIENLPVGARCTARDLATLRKVLRDAAGVLAQRGMILEVGYSVRVP